MKDISQHTNTEQRRENGLSLMMIGFMLFFFDALVTFFMPAGVRLGHQRSFVLLISSAAIAGAILIVIGAYFRKEKE